LCHGDRGWCGSWFGVGSHRYVFYPNGGGEVRGFWMRQPPWPAAGLLPAPAVMRGPPALLSGVIVVWAPKPAPDALLARVSSLMPPAAVRRLAVCCGDQGTCSSTPNVTKLHSTARYARARLPKLQQLAASKYTRTRFTLSQFPLLPIDKLATWKRIATSQCSVKPKN
jgi:hypothetical protein